MAGSVSIWGTPKDYGLISLAGLVAQPLRDWFLNLQVDLTQQLEEIRLRAGRPLELRLGKGGIFLAPGGVPCHASTEAYQVTRGDLERAVQIISQSSYYAWPEELRGGYLTVSGGHRVGFVGEAVVDGGTVVTLKNISSLNLRLAREVKGCADRLMPLLLSSRGQPYHTLLISPPRSGKTTLLRDIVRQLSAGIPSLKLDGFQVGLVDERSEVAGCYQGLPQKDVGPRTDVLDRCPKAVGMLMLIRSMGPEVLATDELGRSEDFEAVGEAINAGVKVITTVHGNDLGEVARRPGWNQAIKAGIFERHIILGRSRGVGTVELVLDKDGGRVLARGLGGGETAGH